MGGVLFFLGEMVWGETLTKLSVCGSLKQTN